MIGLEPTFDAHLTALVAVFREVRRVLRSDGCCWLNYGDAYAGGGRGGSSPDGLSACDADGNEQRRTAYPVASDEQAESSTKRPDDRIAFGGGRHLRMPFLRCPTGAKRGGPRVRSGADGRTAGASAQGANCRQGHEVDHARRAWLPQARLCLAQAQPDARSSVIQTGRRTFA